VAVLQKHLGDVLGAEHTFAEAGMGTADQNTLGRLVENRKPIVPCEH